MAHHSRFAWMLACLFACTDHDPVRSDVSSTEHVLGPNRVSIGEPTVAGSLDLPVVKRTVVAHADRLRVCYDERAKQVPGLAGSLTIEFMIAPDGTVSEASVAEDSTVDEVVSTCMAEAFKQMRFTEPGRGRRVEASIPLDLGRSG